MADKEEKFVFKYNGDLEYIDFETLYVSQLHFTEFIKELKSSLFPEGDLKIKVKALPKGSFPIELFLTHADPTTIALLTVGAFGAVGTIVGAINGVIDLFKHLKGRKPDSERREGDITIIMIDKVDFTIPTATYEAVKNNPKIRKHLSSTFDIIDEDNDIEGVEILDQEQKESYVNIPRTEFIYFEEDATQSVLEVELPGDREIVKTNAHLSIFRVVFSRGFKWQFVFEGHKIYANIEDDNFLLKVSKGQERFANGDVMRCELSIQQKFNEIANVYENHSYKITTVHEIIHRPEQKKLFDDDEQEKK